MRNAFWRPQKADTLGECQPGQLHATVLFVVLEFLNIFCEARPPNLAYWTSVHWIHLLESNAWDNQHSYKEWNKVSISSADGVSLSLGIWDL